MQMRKKVERKLMELGVTPNLMGFNYICEAIDILVDEPNIKTIALYALIAKKCKTTSTSVERTIRHAITKVNADTYHAIGGCGMRNSEFLHAIAVITKNRKGKAKT